MAIKVVITSVTKGPAPGGFTVAWEARDTVTNAPVAGVNGTLGLQFPQFVTLEDRRDSILRELTGYFAALKRDYDRGNEDFPLLKPFLEGMEFEV